VNSLPQGFKALVLGASGAIGAAVVAELKSRPSCQAVVVLSRSSHPGFDLCNEESLVQAAASVREQAPFHVIFCATGVLQVDGRAPEKRLADIDPAQMARALAINAIGPALVIKHFSDLMPLRERALLAVLSARVGSIGDNHKGGWYSYRASKAALNMLLRTAAIEVARKRPLAVLSALHPGTVASALSAPIIGNTAASTPQLAAQHLLAVLDGLPAEGASGGFYAWDGSPIAW
jgi:NAD(P)-dependent dehydrogenase (short-subunit alcohol dehydrogenase family)